MSKVSVVISVYNKAPWLAKCLDSIIDQTFSDIDILIIDNGSTDNSSDIIKEYMSKDNRIRLISLKKNIGPAGGEAIGIDNVKTEYFTIFDADDYADNNYIEVLYNEITLENADIAMCTNDYVYGDGKNKINNRPIESKIIFNGKEVKKLLPQLLDHKSNEYLGYYLTEIGAAWSKLYRTSMVINARINYEKDAWIWSDYLFNFRVLKETERFVYTKQTVYHNFMSENSTIRSKQLNKNRISEMEYILKRFAEECKDIEDKDHKLFLARSRFNARVIFGLVGYYGRYYKTSLSFNDEIEYLKKICSLQATKEMRSRIHKTAVPFYKIRSFLLKHGFYWAEIMYMVLRYGKGN